MNKRAMRNTHPAQWKKGDPPDHRVTLMRAKQPGGTIKAVDKHGFCPEPNSHPSASGHRHLSNCWNQSLKRGFLAFSIKAQAKNHFFHCVINIIEKHISQFNHLIFKLKNPLAQQRSSKESQRSWRAHAPIHTLYTPTEWLFSSWWIKRRFVAETACFWWTPSSVETKPVSSCVEQQAL